MGVKAACPQVGGTESYECPGSHVEQEKPWVHVETYLTQKVASLPQGHVCSCACRYEARRRRKAFKTRASLRREGRSLGGSPAW